MNGGQRHVGSRWLLVFVLAVNFIVATILDIFSKIKKISGQHGTTIPEDLRQIVVPDLVAFLKQLTARGRYGCPSMPMHSKQFNLV